MFYFRIVNTKDENTEVKKQYFKQNNLQLRNMSDTPTSIDWTWEISNINKMKLSEIRTLLKNRNCDVSRNNIGDEVSTYLEKN